MVRGLGAIAIAALTAVWSFLAWFGVGLGQAASPLAVQLPFNEATAARRQLLSVISPLSRARRDELATIALRRAPLSPQPLTYLALVAERAGDEAKAQRLLDLVKSQGWHDEAVQRILYNWDVSGGDHAIALQHAEALLRQGLAADDLTADFASRSADTRFRSDLVSVLEKQGGWADRWTSLNAPGLDDGTLAALFASSRFRAARSAESLAAVASHLVQTGRARLAWRLAHGQTGLQPIRLDWLAEADFPASVVFAWQVPPTYAVQQEEGSRQVLRRQNSVGGGAVQLRFGLEPGRYRLAFPGIDPATASAWRAAIACNANPAPGVAPVGPQLDFAVDQACQLQVLSILADRGATSALPAPLLQRLGDWSMASGRTPIGQSETTTRNMRQ